MRERKLYILLLVILIILKVDSQNIKTFTGLVDNQYINPSNWNPSGVPLINEVASISTNNSLCLTSETVSVAKIVVGSSNGLIQSTLNLTYGITTLQFIVYKLANVLFNINSTAELVRSINYEFEIYGSVINNNQLLTDAHYFISKNGTFTNGIDGNGTFIGLIEIGPNGTFKNQGNFSSLSVKLDGGSFQFENSQHLNFILLNFTMNNGYLSLSNSLLLIGVLNFLPTGTKNDIIVDNNSTFGFSFKNSTTNEEFGVLTFVNTKFTVTFSQIVFYDVESTFQTNSQVLLTNSSLASSYKMIFDSNSQITPINSVILVNGTFELLSNSISSFKKSKLINQEFIMRNKSRFYLDNSTIHILIADTINKCGVYDESQLIIQNYSDLSMFGVFYSMDSSVIQINNNSLVRIEKQFNVANNSSVTLSSSQLIVYGSMLLYDNGHLLVLNSSQILVLGTVVFNDESTFTIEDSLLLINASFHLNTTHSSGSSIPESYIKRSDVFINNEFRIEGVLKLQNTRLLSMLAVSSEKELHLNNSLILVGSGGFKISNYFKGLNSNCSIQNGIFTIQDNTEFTCENCLFEIIEKGTFYQGSNSTINITNTIFINRGNTNSSSDIILNDSGIENHGKFNLKSNILPSLLSDNSSTNSYKIKNFGNFFINGQLPSTLKILFNLVNGSLNIQQDTTIESFQQSNGTLSLTDKSLTTNNNITMDGGIVQGKGQINVKHFENVGGTLGGKSIDTIIINGSYSQSSKGILSITLDENQNSSFINVTNLVILNGTLIIRIEESSADKELTKEIMTFEKQNGDFNKVIIKTYNKNTGEETVQPDCKVKTQKSSTSLKLLVNPDPDTCNPLKSTLNKSLVIGLTVGLVGGTILLIGLFLLLKNRVGTKILVHKLKQLKK